MRYDRSPRDIFQRELRFYVFRIEGFRLEINQLYFESGVPVALNGYNRPYNRRSLIGMEIFLFSLGKIGHDHMVTEVSCVPVCEESLTFLGVGRIYPKTPLHLFPWEFIADISPPSPPTVFVEGQVVDFDHIREKGGSSNYLYIMASFHAINLKMGRPASRGPLLRQLPTADYRRWLAWPQPHRGPEQVVSWAGRTIPGVLLRKSRLLHLALQCSRGTFLRCSPGWFVFRPLRLNC